MSRVDTLLQAVPGDAPAGPDLSYDPAFHELEVAARGRPERQMGSEVIAGEPPDWNAVQRHAEGLLARTKDLRVAIAWCRARTALAGLDGLAEGCELLDAMLRDYWRDAHPTPDPDDGDATMRGNALASLADASGLVNAVRRAPLLPANPVGQFSQRDLDVAAGRLVPGAATDVSPASQSLIDAAVEASDGEGLLGARDAAGRAAAAIASLSARLEAEPDAQDAPDLAPLGNAVVQLHASLQQWVDMRGLDLPDDAAVEEANGGNGSVEERRGASFPSGDIRTREDVINTLDRICEYYARFEPSSPVPLLLERAKGLVSKDFLAILADLSPATLEQVTNITRPAKGEE